MHKRQKDLLRGIAADLRMTLIGNPESDNPQLERGDLDRELERLGIDEDGMVTLVDALPHLSPTDIDARNAAIQFLNSSIRGIKNEDINTTRQKARREFIDRAAYTWVNRLLALRVMEARGLIQETLRHNPEYDGISEALFILRSDAPTRTAGADGGWWPVVEDACTAQIKHLPGLFDPQYARASLLRPSITALRTCIRLIGDVRSGFTLAEADEAFEQPDAIGWVYQFYQEPAKAQVYAKIRSGGKAETRAEIAAATQLYTDSYIVQWLLQNSLGRSYHEMFPASKLPDDWKYYLHRQEAETLPTTHIQESAEQHAIEEQLKKLTLMEPCCGSGHFLREAFDMLCTMYLEQFPGSDRKNIADRILEHHLYGINIDPRAIQLTLLTLYLRAWEFVRDAPHKPGQRGLDGYQPPRMNIVAAPRPLDPGTLQRHLQRWPEEHILKPLLEGVFEALEKPDVIGSLLLPTEKLNQAIKRLRQPHTIPMDFHVADAELRRKIITLVEDNPDELKQWLLGRVADSYQAEAKVDDENGSLFWREAENGVRLLQYLDRSYAIVTTNPPYMGSGNMDVSLKQYVEQHYKLGKRDLYAAFILRCLKLCQSGGRVAMVTQQSWMFLRSFAGLRAAPAEKLAMKPRKPEFSGLLRETTIEDLAHLGPHGFEEIGGEVVQNAMFVLNQAIPHQDHRIIAIRLVGLKSAIEKEQMLCDVAYRVYEMT
jgi:hypothetical protein